MKGIQNNLFFCCIYCKCIIIDYGMMLIDFNKQIIRNLIRTNSNLLYPFRNSPFTFLNQLKNNRDSVKFVSFDGTRLSLRN